MQGYDLFSAFDETGRWQSPSLELPPEGSLAFRIWLSKRAASLSPTHEVQTLIVSSRPIQPQDQSDADMLFLRAREALAIQSLDQLNGRDAPGATR
jgi:hypothetical protein